MTAKNTQPKIAILLDSYGQFQETLCEHIKDVFEPEGIGVIAVLGRELEPQDPFYDGANSIYDLLPETDVKGFILASASLAHEASLRTLEAFAKTFQHCPIVSMGMRLPGVPSVVLDNAKGMSDLMRHLIEAHGHKRFAFMRGSLNNPDSLEREHVFRSILAKAGLAFNEKLLWEAKFQAIEAFKVLDQVLTRPIDFDVVVAANDEMAYGCIQALNKHNIKIPSDVAVVGFDDLVESKLFVPPLSTVRHSLEEQANISAQLLLSQLQGKAVKEINYVTSTFITRRSCGCTLQKMPFQESRAKLKDASITKLQSAHLLQAREQIRHLVQQDSHDQQLEGQLEFVEELLLSLEQKTEFSVELWQDKLTALKLSLQDMVAWQALLEFVSDYSTEHFRDAGQLSKAYRCCVRLTKFLADLQKKQQALKGLDEEQTTLFMGRDTLNFAATTNFEDLVKAMINILRLKVDRCFVVLYDQLENHLSETSTVAFALNQGEIVEIQKSSFKTVELLPEELHNQAFQDNIVLIPLHVGKNHYGYMLIKAKPRIKFSHEFFAHNFAISLQNILQFQSLQDQSKALEFINAELAQKTNYDELTGLANRVLFQKKLDYACQQAEQENTHVAVLLLDLDGFKYLNDTLGHSLGDHLLNIVAKRLQQRVRQNDTIARLGGDEFAIVMHSINDASIAMRLAKNILEAFSEPFKLQQRIFHITASIGITIYPEDAKDSESLIRHADTAMYQAKAQGKNQYQFFKGELNLRALEQLQLEQNLRKAIAMSAFHLVYQPRFDAKTEDIIGVEALLRWPQDNGKSVSPAVFVPLAEQLGLMKQLGLWVLQQACKQARLWQDAKTQIVTSINLSVHQLQDEHIVETIAQVISETGLEPSRLELEITETAAMSDVEANISKLLALREMGIAISLDDFGTAYSSLSYLKRLPLTSLKIDQSFIKDLRDFDLDNAGQAIVRAIVAMGHSLGFRVVAEGIETEFQKAFLKTLSCDELQGFLLSKPLEAEELNYVFGVGFAQERTEYKIS